MTIQELKSQLSILQVLSHFNIQVNRNNLVRCPFHDDKTPSLQIYPKTNSYCCFSTKCNAGAGDQLQLLEKLLGKTKAEAINLGKELVGYKAESLLEIFTKMRSSLKRSKKAMAYAKSRGLDIANLEVGYNSGIYNDVKNCLVFPLKNAAGQISSFYGRSIVSSASRHFYQTGRSGLYPCYPNAWTKQLILTEGVIDAASLIQRGNLSADTSVLALYGAKVLTPDQESAIKALKQLEEITLSFDVDEAGEAAAEKWQPYLETLLNH